MKSNTTRFAVIGGIAGALALWVVSLLTLRFAPGGVFVPTVSWLHVAWSSLFSLTTVTGAALGAATGYALASAEEGNLAAAIKVCLVTGSIAVLYHLAFLLWTTYVGVQSVTGQGFSILQFIIASFFPILAALMTNVVFLWGIFLLATGFYLRRQQGPLETAAG